MKWNLFYFAVQQLTIFIIIFYYRLHKRCYSCVKQIPIVRYCTYCCSNLSERTIDGGLVYCTILEASCLYFSGGEENSLPTMSLNVIAGCFRSAGVDTLIAKTFKRSVLCYCGENFQHFWAKNFDVRKMLGISLLKFLWSIKLCSFQVTKKIVSQHK